MVRRIPLIALAALALGAGCGPDGPGALEGFGDTGDGDTGDGDPSGDGDGDPIACEIDYDLGSQSPAFLEGFLEVDAISRIEGSCYGDEGEGAEVVIAWTAPHDGEYFAHVDGEFPPELMLSHGTCDPKVGFECAAPFEPLRLFAAAGETFTFVIQDMDAAGGYWFFALEPDSLPPSLCPEGFIDGPSQWSGETFDAGNGFASECGGEEAPDRSYLFVPEITGLYRFDTFGSQFDTVVHIFEGECGGPLLICNDDGPGGGLDSRAEIELFAGQIYTLVIDGFGTSSGEFDANLTLLDATGCPNVNFLPPQVPVIDQWILGDSPPSMPMYSCGPNGGQRRFIWEAPASNDYRFTTQGSEAPTSMMLFSGLCEDGVVDECLSGPPPAGASIERFVNAGEVVDIIVTHQYNAGIGQLIIETAAPVMCNPTPLNGPLPLQVQGVTAGQSEHAGSCGDGSGGAPEAVYSFTAPAAGSYLFTTQGSDYDTILYLRGADCGGPELACNDDAQQMLTSSITQALGQGETVVIFVDGFGGESGNYALNVSQL